MKHQQQVGSPLAQFATIQQPQATTIASNHNSMSNLNDATQTIKTHPSFGTKTNLLNNNNQDNLVTMKNNNNNHEAVVAAATNVTSAVNQKPKKGWLYRYTRNQWTPHWFVLNSGSLTYFRGPSAEITNFLDGVLDLSLIKEVQITSSSSDQASITQQAQSQSTRRGPANCAASPRGSLIANNGSSNTNSGCGNNDKNSLAINATSVAVTSQQTHQHQHHHLQQNQHPHHHQHGNIQNEPQKFFSFSLKMWNGDSNLLAAESVEERQNWLGAIARERLDGYSDSSSGTESANQSGDDQCISTPTTTLFNNNNNDIQENLTSHQKLSISVTTQQFNCARSSIKSSQQQQHLVTPVTASISGTHGARVTTKLQHHLTARTESNEQQIVANYATNFHWNHQNSSQKTSFGNPNVSNNNNSLNKCFLYRNIRNSTEDENEEVDEDEDNDDDDDEEDAGDGGEDVDEDEDEDEEVDQDEEAECDDEADRDNEADEEAGDEGDEDDDVEIISENANLNVAKPTSATLCASTNNNQQIPMKKRVRFDLNTCAHVFQVIDTDATTSSSSSSSPSESEDEIEVDNVEESAINATCDAKQRKVDSIEDEDATSIERKGPIIATSDKVIVNQGVDDVKSGMPNDGEHPAEMTTDDMIITTESEADDEEFVCISASQHPINIVENPSSACVNHHKAIAANLEKLGDCLAGSVTSLVEHMDTSPSMPDDSVKTNNCQQLGTTSISNKQPARQISAEFSAKEPVTSGQLAAHLRREREITQASVSSLEMRLAESQAGQLKLKEACERWQAEVTSMSERHRVRLEQLELRLHELSRELELKRLELSESRERLCHWEGLFYKLKSSRQLGLGSRHQFHRDHYHYQASQSSDDAMCCRHNKTANAITQQTCMSSTNSSVPSRSHNKIALSLAKLFVEPSHRISSASCQGILFRMATDQHKLQHQQLSLKILNQNKQIQRKLNEIEHKVDNINSCQQVDTAAR